MGEQRLMTFEFHGRAPVQPVQSAVHRLFRLFVRDVWRGKLVERHNDIRPQRALYLHRLFGREEVLRAVYKTVELHPLVGNPAQGGKRKHLKSAAVREYGAVPVHKPVQPARTLDKFVTRTEIKVISVGKQYLRPRGFHLFGRKPFHRRLRAHGHKTRRVNHPVFGVKSADSRAGLFAGVYNFEFHFYLAALPRPFSGRNSCRRTKRTDNAL